jgi:outer membrane lipoprotein SlyB
LIRFFAALPVLVPVVLTLSGCGPSYSPDTYATNAAQLANKVEAGVIAGVRPVHISAQGAVGGVAGAAAGGVAGAQVGVGPTSAFTAIGGSVIGGLAGVTAEHVIADTDGFEYIVRKANGEMVGVAQKDEKPLRVGQKVLVIAGPQARVVPDYTVPFEASPKTAALPGPRVQQPDTSPSRAAGADALSPWVEAMPVPSAAGVPPQLPSAFRSPSAPPPVIITSPEVPSAVSPRP